MQAISDIIVSSLSLSLHRFHVSPNLLYVGITLLITKARFCNLGLYFLTSKVPSDTQNLSRQWMDFAEILQVVQFGLW